MQKVFERVLKLVVDRDTHLCDSSSSSSVDASIMRWRKTVGISRTFWSM